MNKYNKMIPSTFKAKEIISNKEITVNNSLEIAPKTALILEIQ
jgi:hypothetical protein